MDLDNDTAEACRRMFAALVTGIEERQWADLSLAVGAVLRCTGPLPDLAEPARVLTEFALEAERMTQPYALLTVAGLADGESSRAVVEWFGRDAGPIALDEITVVTGLAPVERALVAEVEQAGSFTAPPVHADAWARLAGIPAYEAFARRALVAAADRADALHKGEIPYRAEKLFAAREASTLGRAARVALHRDEPWLPSLLDRLLPGISVAPTTARTLPSQALLYELVRAAQEFPTPELVSAIRTVRGTVRHAGVPKQLDKMLKKVDAALAERTDVALRLPSLGFDEDGVLRVDAGDGYTAAVTVDGSAVLTWHKDGRPLRGVPARVRRDRPALVKEVRDLVKRVDAHLLTLARALEGGFTVDAVHPYGRWRAELAGHPLARTVVRRLIWEVEVAPGVWEAVLPEAGELPDAPDGVGVRLWHPIRSAPDVVQAWRDLLVDRQIRQPFKQAFREIYLLTPAEEATGVHSNRFAAHLVHYHRMFALFRARGWASDRLGPWDGGAEDVAQRTLGAGEWRASFHHALADWAGDDLLAATDQVRFTRRVAGAWQEAPLSEVPPLVFSEAMRDVDLFVGVTSIAADPDWTDRGPARAYWERVFLPFEDERLSVILSKALLLADDTKITDPTILAQIRRGG
ncbi:DUF4132 domain-containing protein [Streptomyces sp. NPDC047072]|uniref:DUF4132 domain-containing protein n=1 Tax=Streptomyces sp. NPDC047072 TaxID=3154809 RepID=UPI0033E4B3DC